MARNSATQLSSGNWRIQVRYTDRDGNERRKSITAPTEWEALKLADDFRNGVLEEKTHITVKQAIESYIDCRRTTRAVATISGYDCILRTRLQTIMKMDINSLKKADINRAIAMDVQRGLGYKSMKEAVSLLKSALSEFDVDILPAGKYNLPPKKLQKDELPDIQSVLNAIVGSSVELPCLLSLWCGGMRISEVRGLQYRDISTDKNGNHFIFINRVKVSIGNVDHIRDSNKTEQSTRKVPLPDYLYQMIKDKPHNSEEDFIVDERYLTIKKRYDRLMKKHGLNICFHDLRAEFATVMNSLGIDKLILQKMGGWSNSKVLDSVYIRTPQKAISDSMQIYGDYIESMITNEQLY